MATILIIDDDPATLGLLRGRLQKAGYIVRDAKDGQEGLQVAERERPDLIFLDVRMPKIDGWQVCRTLKSNPVTNHCPVIMLTGCSQDAQELYGLQCGADEYITKPWDAKVLMESVAKLLDQSHASQDVRSSTAQERTRLLIQRVVRMAGNLPKTPNVELMTSQLLRLATTLMTTYQSALTGSQADFRLKIGLVDQQAGELVYWLGLLRDSKASDDPEVSPLLSESNALHDTFTSALKKSRG